MLSQVNVEGLKSSLCFGHLSAGELENPFPWLCLFRE